jgi:dihydroflavonol-4-reductase
MSIHNQPNSEKTVLVSGGSGYLASWAIVELLRQGYRVRTTLRSLKRQEELQAAIARHVEPGDRLSFFQADLMSDRGWAEAIQGSRYVLHVAAPMGNAANKGLDLIPPSREGALRVLRASVKARVERVVLTSSGVTARPAANNTTYQVRPIDETVWTDPTAKDADNYARAKTLAERAAWDFIEKEGGVTTLATVLPVFIEGPLLGKNFLSPSVELIQRLLLGRLPGLPHIGFNIVDVRDVVDLHLRAMVAQEAAGQRFVASSEFLWLEEIAHLLREKFGEKAAKVPTKRLPDLVLKLSGLFNSDAKQLSPMLGRRKEYSSANAEKRLGWQARPARQTIIDSATSLFEVGLA